MNFIIEPLDPVFFRDGKPFEMGEHSWANSLAFPLPSVILGAFRSFYLSHRPEVLDCLDDNDPTGDFQIKALYFRVNNQICVPVPKDLVKQKSALRTDPLIPLQAESVIEEAILPSETVSCPFKSDERVEPVEESVLSLFDFNEYLLNDHESISALPSDKWIVSEPKIGIGRNFVTRGSEEGQLYRVQMRRWQKSQLIVDLDLPGLSDDEKSWFEQGWLKLGGEGKIAHFQRFSSPIDIPRPEIKSGDCFKLYLLTPATFKQGWLPHWINPDTKESTDYFNCEFKLIAAALDKPILIGGFDMKTRAPKEKQYGVSAGSVYLFQFEKGDIDQLIEKLHKQSIAETGAAKNNGFGIALLSHGVSP